MKPDIYKIKEIGRGSLSAMAKPRSGEWVNEEFQGIAESGISKVISLLEVSEARDLDLNQERQLSESNGMDFAQFPIPDRGVPTSLDEYCKFIKRQYFEITNGANGVVHCRAGIGRTGMVTVSILLHSGYDSLEAFELVSEKRGIVVPDTQQQIDWVCDNYKKIIGS